MTVRVFSDQAGTTAAAANDNIGKVEDLSKFDSDGVSSTTGPYLSVDANGFGSADILGQGGDVVQTFTNAIADGSALVVGTSKCIFFSNVNVEAGGTLTIGPAGDMINTNGLNLIGKVVSVATTTKVLTTAEQNSIATFFAERGASSVVVNDETVYDVNSVEADLVLDFNGSSFYRNVPHYFKLGGTYSTFADAFMGTSPKLTYDPGSASSSQSTMVNSSGEIVWAPHNLHRYSSDFSSWASKASITAVSSSGNELGDIPTTLLSAVAGSAQHRIFDLSLTEGNPVTFTFYVKPGTFDYVQFHDGVSASYWADFDLSGNGSVIRHTGLDATPTITPVTSAGQTFFKITVQYTSLVTDILPVISFPDPSTVVASGTRNPTWNAAGTETLYIGGAHLYRSDLGGMNPVPGAATGFETYVPTNGAAEYLPRVGHHVYNGSAWVNEGLLIESEARTNLFDHSEAIVGSDVGNGTSALDGATAQGANAYQISLSALTIDTSAAQGFYLYGSLGTGEHAFSVLLKAGQYTDIRIRRGNVNVDTTTIGTVDLSTGAVTNIDGELTVEPQGNGWFRVSWTDNVNTAGITGFAIKPNSTTHATSNGTDYFLLSQPQVEAGSTPSSYIPTYGSTVTRGGQSLTVPPAEFGWPEPEYIGPELIVDGSGNWVGDFDVIADLDEWSQSETTLVSVSGGTATVSYNGGNATLSKLITVTSGKVYRVTGSISNVVSTGPRFKLGSSAGGTDYLNAQAAGDYDEIFVATSNTLSIYVQCIGAGSLEVDNISVREINPLSVSIQMDGRMTYADDDVDTANPSFAYWDAGSNNYIHVKNNTYGASITGRFDATQDNGTGSAKASVSGNTLFAPGVLVPFNISSRHGSTFVNGAVDGVALTADTTPKALPDLSGTDLEIAQDFMGTIGQFRQFAGDIGDAGLEKATS